MFKTLIKAKKLIYMQFMNRQYFNVKYFFTGSELEIFLERISVT